MRRSPATALGVAAAAVALAAFSTCTESIDVAAAVGDIEARYGVQVRYEIDEDFLPPEWREPPANGEASRIDDRELARLLRQLPSWLDKYPVSVLRENLREVRLSGRLKFFDVLYAGTSDADVVWLVSEGKRLGFSDTFLELTFHHELSSLLMYRHAFPIDDWMEASPAGFEYMTEWDEFLGAVERRRKLDGDPLLYRKGLLGAYGRTNLENDVNLYAELSFTDPQRMKRLVEKYPAVRAKYEVLKSFYVSISPEFETWFARIGQTAP